MPRTANYGVEAGEAQAVAAVMEDQDMVLVARLPIQAAPTRPGARRAAPGPQEISVEVDLDPDENAVVLLEQDGLYAWHFDSTESTPPATQRSGAKATKRRVTFRLPLGESAKGTMRKRGWLSDLIVGQAQAFVFKFAGRFLLNRGAAFLERKVQTGLILMDKDDPSAWKLLGDFSALTLPADRPARILLFVHGTFSSTRGGFGALGATPWGRSFLAAARANYDAVVGFDHPTLSVDPLANATALLGSLESRKWLQPAIIDAISHSRGGITLRSLTEYLLPATTMPVRIERAVFVGAVNGGTELAEPKNWRTLINLYTNVAAGACRAIAMFPQVTFAAALTEELLKSVGVLAKVLAEEAITEQVVPGLAAMQPLGGFITGLNQTQPNQPTAALSRCYAITSEFRASLALDSVKELPRQLLLALADGAVDRLMGKANDLVVNTDSMTHIDPHAGSFIKDTLAFGKNGVVYHTNYFLQPQVTNALARWLELETTQTASPTRLRGAVRGGEPAPLNVPARVDTDVIVALAEDRGSDVRDRIKDKTPSYVVVERSWENQRLNYAFTAEEVVEAVTRRPRDTLMDALDLHETDASPVGQSNVLPPSPARDTGRPSARRVVALDEGKVVGVAEAGVPPTPLAELVQRAKVVTSPKTEAVKILARRTMPTFLSRTAAAPRTTRSIPRSGSMPRGVGGGSSGAKPAAGSGTPVSGGAAGGVPPTATCHFLAQMDDEAVVDKITSVDVTLSREIVQAAKAVNAGGSAPVKADRKITVEVIPTKNFVSAGETRVDVDLPQPGSPVDYVFDVKATDVGDGEILVRIRQEMQPFAKLVLHCRIVAQRTGPAVRGQPESISVEEIPPTPQPRHQLAILEIERGGQMLYHYTLESPSLGIRSVYESKPLKGSREDYIKGVYEDIEDRYLSNKTDFDQFQQELREVGAALWDELFPPELQAELWKWRDAIDSILVFSEEPFIPWELVHLKEPSKGLGAETRFFGQMGLVRWLSNVGWPTTELRARAGHCHYVIPKYPHPDYKLVGAEEEAEFLEKRFKATAVDPHAGPLRKLLETPGGFDLLHFACHGVADSGDIARAELLLEGRVDGGNYVMEKLRASVIENLPGLVGPEGIHPIVALNACQAGRAGYKMTSIGGFSRAFLKQGAGMFVAAMWSVGDAPARKFTEKLYERLLAKDTLAQASIAARLAARADKEATWLAYTVYGNPHAKLKT